MGARSCGGLVCFTNHDNTDVSRKIISQQVPLASGYLQDIPGGVVQQVVLTSTVELENQSSKSIKFYNCQMMVAGKAVDDFNKEIFFAEVAKQLKNQDVAVVGGCFPNSRLCYMPVFQEYGSEYSTIKMFGFPTLRVLAWREDVKVTTKERTPSMTLHVVDLLDENWRAWSCRTPQD